MPREQGGGTVIDATGWPLVELARSWEAARPFPHVVIDGLFGAARLTALREAFAREPHWPVADQLYTFMASGEPPSQPELLEALSSLSQPAVLGALQAITGKRLARAEGRAYVYLAGHYLLPHSDCREGVGRQLAFAWYLDGAAEGGELELFESTLSGGQIVATAPAARIAPRPDRLALFDVSPSSLHQVCEVLAGARASLSGWFYS